MGVRLPIVGAASAVGVLAFGIGPAASAAGPVSKAASSSSGAMSCKASVTTEIPAGATRAVSGAQSGKQWGPVHCRQPLGIGVQKNAFTIPDSGDMVGTFRAYFAAGTVYGKFVLSPEAIVLSTSLQEFTSFTYSGKMNIKSGSGAWSGAKGTGTATCKSADGLHFKCTEKLTLTKP
jgi:hypothetical protein